MKTIRNYNAPHGYLLRYATAFAIGLAAFAAQAFFSQFPKQGLDLIDSFFIYLLMAQFVHLSWVHLALNAAAMWVIVWGFSGSVSCKELIFTQLISFVWIAFYLTSVEPLTWYCGLSGALHLQFTVLLGLAWIRNTQALGQVWPLILMTLGLLTKLVLETWHGVVLDEMIGGPVAIQAHRAGVFGGLILLVLSISWRFFESVRRV